MKAERKHKIEKGCLSIRSVNFII